MQLANDLPHNREEADQCGAVLFARLVGIAVEFLDFYIYATAAVD
jgi:hypothetical protein